jgi:hypothetical protein
VRPAPSRYFSFLLKHPLINILICRIEWVMAGVDPERELTELKYDLKGA